MQNILNDFPLRNWDEAWYGEIIKNLASGEFNLLVPFWNGQYYFDKPPLYFWLSLPFYKFIGPGEWQVRIVSILASIFSFLLVYLIGKKLFNKRVGFISVLVLLSLGQVIVRFSHGNLDALLICFSLATFYFYLLSLKNWRYSILSGITLGLSYLTKGWFLGLYPLAVIFAHSILVEKRFHKNLVTIVVVSLLSSMWYFVLGFISFGKTFVDWYIFNPTASQVGSKSISFSGEYLRFFIRDLGFWIVPLALHLIKVRGQISAKLTNTSFLFVVSLSFIFFLNLLVEESDWYLLPAYPFVAIFVARVVHQLFKDVNKITALLLLLLPLQIFVVYKIENLYPDRSAVGATLGVRVKKLVLKNEKLVFDDHDFTSFLYYSNHKMVYTTSELGGKDWEWWTLKRKDLETFIKANKKVLLVTPNLDNFQIDYSNMNLVDYYSGYYFLRAE
ncbi:MAG: Glycosyl transferase family protein [Microgenomates group bacterium GW2011_GWA2_39_19]|nr:MAG: Glycosyl transferase family protein [Microgenomates group bacterium GW2011_GWA2_39_19]HBL52282.1 hypothetical protein [Candidatus Blackburnbacteria bacterium]